MEMALSAKNKLQFVDGSLPRLATTDAQWTRRNDMVASWILNSVSKQLAKSVLYIDSVVGIWKDLNDRFFQGNGPQIFQIQKSIVSLSQGQDIVSTYFTNLKGLWEELSNYKQNLVCSCSTAKLLVESYHQECIMQFLMELIDSYSQLRGQILLIEPLPSINKVFSLVVQNERQRDIFVVSLSVETTAFFHQISKPEL